MDISSVKKKSLLVRIFSWVSIVLVLAGFVGVIVSVLMAESTQDVARETACWYAAFGCIGGIFLGILCTLVFFRLGEKLRKKEEDLRELDDSPESFFVGEKVLATFEETQLVLHAERGAEAFFQTVRLDYDEIKFVAIRLRRSPRDKGERHLLLKLPDRIAKEGQDGLSIITMDDKPRLKECIEKHGVTLVDGVDDSEMPPVEKKFVLKMRDEKLVGKIISLSVAVMMIVAGVLVAVLGGNFSMLGYFLGVFGAITLVRSVRTFLRGGSAFIVYSDGVFWKEPNKQECFYLRFGEIEHFSKYQHEKRYFVKFTCAYGDYFYPDVNGLYDYLCRNFPEKKKAEEKKRK